MTDTTVRVRLEAVTNIYTAAMARAGQSTTKFAKDALASTRQVATGLQNVQTEATIGGAALLGIGIAAVAASTNFDKSMSKVKAVSGATAGQMDRLRQSALDAGQATVFSASQAADAQAELAKAGVSTADILGGALTGSLDLAAAGQLDLAQAATISAQAMNVFKLKGSDVGHIADVLAAGANKSAADVDQLGQALQQGGLVAQQTGLSLEDTVGVLSAFADRALIGSDAGTSLKTMLQRLVNPSDEARDAMDELGITAYDAQGNFVGLEKFAGSLQSGLKDLDPAARGAAMGVIFGSDAVRAANVIYDLGEQGVRDYTRAVNDQGAASRMAADQLDNLAGDLEQLSGSIETTFIKAGTGANDTLRGMTQAATATVNFIGELPPALLTAGVAASVAGGSFLIAAPRIAAFNAALASTPALARAASGALKGIGPAIAVTAVFEFALAINGAREDSERFEAAYRDLRTELGKKITTTGIDDLYGQIKGLENALDNPSFSEKLARGAFAINNTIANAFGGVGAEESPYDRQLKTLQDLQGEYERYKAVVSGVATKFGVDVPRAIELVNESGISLNGTTDRMVAGVSNYVDATQQGSAASQAAAGAMDVLNDATASLEEKLNAANQAWEKTIGLMLGMSDAKIAAEAAVDALVESIKENGNAWDISTEAGRENMSLWNDLVRASQEVRSTKLEEGATVDEANAAYKRYLEQVRDAPGLTDKERAAVQRLIDKYDDLPEVESTKVDADTSRAMAKLNALASMYAALDSSYSIGGSTYQSQVPAAAAYPHTGGWIVPTGLTMRAPFASRGTDTVAAMLTPGEAVVNKVGAQRNAGVIDAINAGAVISGGYGGAKLAAVSGSSGGGSGYVHNGDIYAVPAPGESVGESIVRAQRRQTYIDGFGGA